MASLLRQIVAGPRSRHPETGLDLCYVTDQIIATSGPSATYPQLAYRNPLDRLVRFLDAQHGSDWAIWEFRAEGTGYPDAAVHGRISHYPWPDHHPPPFRLVPLIMAGMRNWLREPGGEAGNRGRERKGRVVVVHCKAGKGRSGTMACSYLISECGWTASEALARFTERRMRPGFGPGVSIPSQLRWIGYVDRWTRSGKVYVERQIEILEVHVWGLRHGVRVQVEGYVDEGKTIKLFHVFTKKERIVVEGGVPGERGSTDLAGFQNDGKESGLEGAESASGSNNPKSRPYLARGHSSNSATAETSAAPGGRAVIFKPSTRVILPHSDINIDFERRNKASMGWTMVTAVAHVWFNAFFEGNGPERNGIPDENGVFEIDWDKMDGIKGSSRKGTRAFDRMAVVWSAYKSDQGLEGKEDVIHQPGEDSPVPQIQAADWKGGKETSLGLGGDLGLRIESPVSANVSKASSIKSNGNKADEESSAEGVKSSGPTGEEGLDVDLDALPQPNANASGPDLAEINNGLDTASAMTPQRGFETPDAASRTDLDRATQGVVEGVSQLSTKDLPDGVPEDQLEDAKEYLLGHFQFTKKR